MNKSASKHPTALNLRKFLSNELLLIGLAFVLYASNISWGGNRWKDIIETDGKGYYSYLPAVFIYHDLQCNFHDSIEKRYYNLSTYYDYRINYDGVKVNKYFAGTAIAQLPFFLAAHVIAKFSHQPTDGFSAPYQIAINLAAIFYVLAGLWFIKKWLLLEGTSASVVRWTILLLAFGTPLFYYSVSEPAMSHAYSFFFVSAFCFFSRRYFQEGYHGTDLLRLGFLTGMILIIRPVNGIVLLSVPFLAGSNIRLKAGIRSAWLHSASCISAIVVLLLIITIQPTLYYLETGRWMIYTYGNESLRPLDAHILDFLLSYRKGFFVYTPLALISLWGLRKLSITNAWRSLTIALFLAAVVWLLSSWNVWWYGGSFSQRPMVEFLPFFAFLLSLSLLHQENQKLSIIKIFGVLAVVLCMFQTLQYRYYLIHWERMDKAHYWRVFLSTEGIKSGENPNKDLLIP